MRETYVILIELCKKGIPALKGNIGVVGVLIAW